MSGTYISLFTDWVSSKRGELTTSLEGPDPSARLDIDTDQLIGRITYWSSGFCDAEIMEVNTENYVYQKHWEHLPPDNFDFEFAEFFRIIG